MYLLWYLVGVNAPFAEPWTRLKHAVSMRLLSSHEYCPEKTMLLAEIGANLRYSSLLGPGGRYSEA